MVRPLGSGFPRRRDRLGLVAGLLTGVIAVYPLLGTLIVATPWPSLVASVPSRLVVALVSLQLLWLAPRRRSDSAVVVLWLFWCACLIRLLWDASVADVPGALETLGFFALTLLSAVAALRMPPAWWNEVRVARTLFVTGATTSGFAVLFTLAGIGADRSLVEWLERMSFDTVNPITYGHVAVSTSLAALCCRPESRVGPLVLLGCGLAAALAALHFAASRGPFLSLIVCALVAAIFHRRFRWLSLAAVPTLLILMLSGSALEQRFADIDDDPSAIERLLVQINAIQQFVDHPWFGSAYVELESMLYPHNPFIEAAMATGLVGLLLFAWIVGATLRRSLLLLRAGAVLLPLLTIQYVVAAQLSGSLFASTAMWTLVAMTLATPLSRRRLGPAGPGAVAAPRSAGQAASNPSPA